MHGKAEAKTKVIFAYHSVTLVDTQHGRLENFRASTLQLRMKGIEIVHPNVSINGDAAPRNVRRGQSSVIGLSKVNYNVIAGDDSEHGRVEEITQYLESQDVAIVFRRSNDIGNDKVGANRFALRFRFGLRLCHSSPSPHPHLPPTRPEAQSKSGNPHL